MSDVLSLEVLYDRYIKFLAIPKASRIASKFKIVSKEDFAKHYGLDMATLAHFEDRTDYQSKFSAARKEWARTKTPELLEILYNKYVKTQNTQDLKLWLELTGEISSGGQQASQTTNIVNLFNISDEQKKAIVERLNKRLSAGA